MAKVKKLSLQANFLLDLKPHLQGLKFVSINLSQQNHLFLLATKHPLDYRQMDKSGASFAKAHPETPNDFVVLEFKQANLVKTTELPNQPWNYHFAQPLPNEELLLVCARVRGETSNARVFDSSGILKRDFTLGDGIQHVQTTVDGHIWVGYFDEGVFGDTPISQSGINCFDKFGQLIYAHADESMADCYALNVVSNDEVWSCYYTDFPLVQIVNQQVKNSWDSPVRGSGGFVIWKNFVLFRGGYKKIKKDDLVDLKGYQLLEAIPNQAIKELATVEILDNEGNDFGNLWMLTRCSKMLLMDEKLQCYEVGLSEVVSSYYQN
jgi:hypothetical protein